MLVILIIVCAMVFFFCIFTIILHGIAKDKLKVEERIKDFVLEEKEERKKTTTKKKRLKVKKNTGFKTRKELAQIENELYNVGIQIPVQQFIVIWGIECYMHCIGCSDSFFSNDLCTWKKEKTKK